MNESLKLIEGMKKLKVLEKHMQRNAERIQQYASIPSNEKPYFGDEKTQMAEVKQLIQSNEDLLDEYLHLKKRVDMTNLTTKVTIGKNAFTLADLLILRRGLSKRMQQTFHALNDRFADERIKGYQQRISTQAGEKPVHVVRLYDEKEKFERLQYWQGLDDEIEQRLEVINATTDLVTI
ncbi:MAG: hypothetical protein JRC90_11065 [Deltaproteobacteria bacterium]|nr:hypothetical protein [Deltaproteobacteria bacterium]